MWITTSPVADVFVVWANPRSSLLALSAPSAVLCSKRHEGIECLAIHGQVARQHHRRDRDGRGVRLEENAFPEVQGLKGPFTCLNSARYGIAWGALGAAEFCWHTARQYTLDRKTVWPPAGANQLVQKKLADMQTEIAIGLQACLQFGRMKDAGTASVEAAPPSSKRNSCGKALDIARLARDMMGGNGISDEFGVARHPGQPGSSEHLPRARTMCTALISGRAQTGIAAFAKLRPAARFPPHAASARFSPAERGWERGSATCLNIPSLPPLSHEGRGSKAGTFQNISRFIF